MVVMMNEIIFSIILIIFPILMYLVFTCYNSLLNKKIERLVFIITILTSLYLSLRCNLKNVNLLIFCNIPILICYFRKEGLLGLIISFVVIIYSYVMYDINIYIGIFKYLSYFITYMLLYEKKEFSYLFFKVSGIIQGFFLSFEYFMHAYNEIEKVIDLIFYIIIIYSLTFFCLYLFKIANNISNLYLEVNKVREENKLKNSLYECERISGIT